MKSEDVLKLWKIVDETFAFYVNEQNDNARSPQKNKEEYTFLFSEAHNLILNRIR